jgi:hypothetical protein
MGPESRSRLSAAGTAAPPAGPPRKSPTPLPKQGLAPLPPRADATAARKDGARATNRSAPTRRSCVPIVRPASQPVHCRPSLGPGTTNCPVPTATMLCQVLNASSAEPRQWHPMPRGRLCGVNHRERKRGGEKGGVATITARRISAVTNRTAHPLSNAGARFRQWATTDFAKALPHSLCGQLRDFRGLSVTPG